MADPLPDPAPSRFELLGELGRGGMATVHLALDRRTGERVALKLLHPHLCADPSARRRLDRELAAARRLDHPGVLVAREAVEVDGQIGLVLPLHAGRTLAEVVALNGPLPADQVRRLGLRLAEALAAAHRAGVLHRDLSPRNVLLDERGAPVLADFGLARVQETQASRSTALLGTAGYVAPEVLAGGRAEPRSDLYALGAVLHLAATGQEAFGGGHPQAALTAQLAGRRTPITATVPGFPAWLDQTIGALLDPDPERRPSGAAALVRALEGGVPPDLPASGAQRPPRSLAGEAAAAQALADLARLPRGPWTVAITSRGSGPARHHRRRARRSRLLERGSAGGAEETGTAEDLARAVAREAGLPPEALRASPVLDEPRFRLIAHVDLPTAERLAEACRPMGLRAAVHREGEPSGAVGWLLGRWWALIPLMWVAFPALMMLGAPGWTVYALTAATILLATVVGPFLNRGRLPPRVARLPVAYTDDLSAHLAPGLHLSPGPPRPSPEATSRGPATRLRSQAEAAIDELLAAVQAHEASLPGPVQADLRASARELRGEVRALGEEAARLEAALEASAPAEVGWAAERLARGTTLERAGQPFPAEERARLEAALAAHEAAQRAEEALDSQRTATLARLLEIAATARRLAHELAVEQAQARPTAEALDDLRRRAAAAAAARRELG